MKSTIVAHRQRPGGGFFWSIDTEDRSCQIGPLLISRARQPDGAPLVDEASVSQRYKDDDGLGWILDWYGLTLRSGLTLSVPAHSRVARNLRWVMAAGRRCRARAAAARWKREGSTAPTGAQRSLDTGDWDEAHGYWIGAVLPTGCRPWPTGRADDVTTQTFLHHSTGGGPHRWELVSVRQPGMMSERVVRCSMCLTPRCGHSLDADPCMLRRHHDGDHAPLSTKGWP